MKFWLSIILFLLGSLLFGQSDTAELFWPREIKANKYTITLYQPQLETLKDNLLSGRMALSVKDDADEMLFGALWFEAHLSTNLDTRTAFLEKIGIPKVIFPDVDEDSKLTKLKDLIIKDLESIDMEMSLDRIMASVEKVEKRNEMGGQLNNDAPKIYFRSEPTVLVSIDGDPILEKVKDTEMEYVVNTPFFIAKENDFFYLKGKNDWYKNDKIVSNNWETTIYTSNNVKALAKKKFEDYDTPKNLSKEKPVTAKIIVETKPAELILTDGKPVYEPIKETQLLYVSNSESDILMDINSQQHFLLVNGRWYSSKTLKDDGWTFIEPDALPKDFASIPADTSMGISSVRTSVPGTPESLEAMYEQYVPQTAVVDRKTATVEVTYDGDPKFDKIEGTSLYYAINTDASVLRSGTSFYCIDNGIWFKSNKATGPWEVADSRPDDVDDIPANYPIYNVKYVYIYESTPEVVYVGYTPGYYHCHVYGGVIVYGTGYYYYPWYGHHYYPRPVTYGYGVHYSPYTGWGFSVGVSYGWLSISAHSSYWGAAGYHHGYRHGYNSGYHHGYNRGYAKGYAHGKYNSNNVYQKRANGNGVTRTGNYNREKVQNRRNSTPSNKPNNMYTDKKGNVHQRDNNGNWKQQSNKPKTKDSRNNSKPKVEQRQTKPKTNANPSKVKPKTPQKANPKMENQYKNRSKGNSSYQQYKKAPSTGSRSYGGRSGGRSYGGRRR